MNRLMALTVIIALVTALVSVDLYGESGSNNWPTWRGPDSTGTAKNGNPPITWSETKNIMWKVKVPGEGQSSPIVWEDKIFFLTAVETDKKVETDPNTESQEQNSGGGRSRRRRMSVPPKAIYKFDVVCMNRKNGDIIWQKTAREELPHEGHQPNNSYASYSPVTDGKYVWVSFGSRGVHCYDMGGNHKWSVDLGKMKTRMAFGEGSSAALAGDTLIVVIDHEGDSFIYALNKDTGEIIWKQARDEGTMWATPIAVDVNDKTQVITNATNFVRSYDVKTGDVIWQCSGQTASAIPCPVSGFGKVFCMSGFRGSMLQAIELGHTGDLSDSNAISWQVKEATPYVPSPLLYGDKLYFCFVNKAIVSCYQADTGKANFVKQPLEGMNEIFASPVGVADRVYFVGRDGVTAVIKNSDKFEVLATNKLDDKFDASPAIAGDELFLKGKEYIYCIAKR